MHLFLHGYTRRRWFEAYKGGCFPLKLLMLQIPKDFYIDLSHQYDAWMV